MSIIYASDISHTYEETDGSSPSLNGITFSIQPGELIAILGCNGCGKSTLARHINALIPLQSGELTIAGLNAKQEKNIWKIRRSCGMVFQNPENQFVSSIIEEDIAFGLENYDVPDEEIPGRIRDVLKLVGMEGYEKRSPHMLSGGQKQKIAIAGVLAINPDILIFDEVTAMLDADGRQEVLDAIRHLHSDCGKTILMISHYIEETTFADRIFLMCDGRVVKQGTPGEILTDKPLLEQAGLTPPLPVQIYYDMKQAGVPLPFCPLTGKELVDALCQLR